MFKTLTRAALIAACALVTISAQVQKVVQKESGKFAPVTREVLLNPSPDDWQETLGNSFSFVGSVRLQPDEEIRWPRVRRENPAPRS